MVHHTNSASVALPEVSRFVDLSTLAGLKAKYGDATPQQPATPSARPTVNGSSMLANLPHVHFGAAASGIVLQPAAQPANEAQQPATPEPQWEAVEDEPVPPPAGDLRAMARDIIAGRPLHEVALDAEHDFLTMTMWWAHEFHAYGFRHAEITIVVDRKPRSYRIATWESYCSLCRVGAKFFVDASHGNIHDITKYDDKSRGLTKDFIPVVNRDIASGALAGCMDEIIVCRSTESASPSEKPFKHPRLTMPLPAEFNDVRTVSVAKAWQDCTSAVPWKRVVNKIMFYPVDEPDNWESTTLNVFHEFRKDIIEPDMTATDADVQVIVDHINRLADGDQVVAARYFDRLAMMHRAPWVRVHSYDMTIGGQGTGKSLLGRLYYTLFGHRLVRSVSIATFNTRFDDAMDFALVVLIDEAEDDKSRLDGAKLRLYSTAEWRGTEGKGKAAGQTRSLLNFVVMLNRMTSIRLENGDRRANILKHGESPLTYEQRMELGEFVNSREKVAKLAGWLAKRDLSKFDPFSPAPRTAAKEDAILESQGDRVQRIKQLYGDEAAPFHGDIIYVPAAVAYLCKHVAEFQRGASFKDSDLKNALSIAAGSPIPNAEVVFSPREKKTVRMTTIRHFHAWGEKKKERGKHYDAWAKMLDNHITCSMRGVVPSEPSAGIERPFEVPSAVPEDTSSTLH